MRHFFFLFQRVFRSLCKLTYFCVLYTPAGPLILQFLKDKTILNHIGLIIGFSVIIFNKKNYTYRHLENDRKLVINKTRNTYLLWLCPSYSQNHKSSFNEKS